MILLWGLPGDEPFDRVRQALANANCDVELVDQRASLEQRLEAADGTSGALYTGRSRIDLDDVHSIYTRIYDARQVPQLKQAPPATLQRVDALHSALWAWADDAPACVLNRPSAMASNGSKPYQAMLIERHAFLVPETLVTTDIEAAMAFWGRHGDIIYKSVSGVRSVVSRLQSADRSRLPDIAWCPTQFQAWIAGCDYRVHVVGHQVFAVQIICDADDYRYAHKQGHEVELRSVELAPDIADAAVRLATALRLPLAGLDLRRTPDGKWYCFKVNPSPCFTYYENLTGQPIAAAVAELLATRYQ